jgi:beta-galactosidase
MVRPRRALLITLALFCSLSFSTHVFAQRVRPFDTDWRFTQSDSPGAEQPAADDSTWRQLKVPHDWSIEGPFDEHAPAGMAGGFLPGGVGWYRKHFTLPQSDANRRVFIEFDGVMANSDVWINATHLGHRPYGYVSFRYELTGHVNFGEGKPNIIAVRADNAEQPASRWYSGAGIYRHVRLIVTDPVHLDFGGTYVTTPEVSAERATVHVQNSVVNQSESARDIVMKLTVLAPDGSTVATSQSPSRSVDAGKSVQIEQDLTIPSPQLWGPGHPSLYRVVATVSDGQKPLDEETSSFGIRHAEFRADTGFWLNGVNMKLLGVCLHHDCAPFGAAVPLRAWERRLEILQSLGVNAIRTAHNPPAPEFLDLCDRMGLLVMDEMFDCWTVGKNKYDYHLYFKDWAHTDTRDTVLRDRNHPSIIIYSAGNEIHDLFQGQIMFDLFPPLRDVFHQYDPSRPVTMAVLRPNVAHVYDNGFAELMDVVGQNYRENELVAAHLAKPDRKVIGTENHHDRAEWLYLRDNPFFSGQFLWAGIDYLGESHGWPNVFSSAGLLDHTGTPRAIAFERQSWWSDKPMVHIVRSDAPPTTAPATLSAPGLPPPRRAALYSDWTPRNASAGSMQNVLVFSNCKQVELFLNEKSLGSKSLSADAAPRAWRVSFEPGTLKAVAKNDDQPAATHELHTAGKAAKIVLSADRKQLTSDWDDVCYVRATIVDDNGVQIPDARDVVHFTLSGPGTIAAVDSGDIASHEPFAASERRAFGGQCFAILKATSGSGDRMTITASADGLTGASTQIETIPQK